MFVVQRLCVMASDRYSSCCQLVAVGANFSCLFSVVQRVVLAALMRQPADCFVKQCFFGFLMVFSTLLLILSRQCLAKSGHVWTPPFMQEEFSCCLELRRVLTCVRPQDAAFSLPRARMEVREPGPNHTNALDALCP